MADVMGRTVAVLAVIIVALSGCATMPSGPSAMVLPSQGKPFEEFQIDDSNCRQWSSQQIGASPGAPMNQNAAAGAVIGTLVGAGIGAAFGAVAGNPGAGAAIGAGTGLLGGAASGSNADWASSWEAQRRYDIAFQQCMYAKGHQIPGVIRQSRRGYRLPPPPPPPGYAPPPAALTPQPPVQ